MKIWSTMLVVTLACLVGLATAAPQDKAKKDAAKKPAPTLEEKLKKAEGTFKTLDVDKDGKLSDKEFAARKKDAAKAGEQFKKLDTNKDGFLSLEEYQKPLQKQDGKKGEKKAEKKAEKKCDKKPEKKAEKK